jgi:hypothetical protein
MQLVSTVTVGAGGASSISFTDIPSDGTDLLLLISAQTNASGEYVDLVNVRFNGSTSGYSDRDFNGNGTSVFNNARTSQTSAVIWGANATGATANTFSNSQIYIPNYAGAAAKSFSADTVTENNASTARQALTAALWSETAAITQITLTRTFGTLYTQHSTASLYKITKA